jgi:hypothetical protein
MSKRKQSTPRPPRTRNRFRERELARAGRVAKAIGAERVEIDPQTGKISVVLAKSGKAEGTTNPWDEVLTTDAPNQERPT